MSESTEDKPQQGRYDQYTRFALQPEEQQSQYGANGSQAVYGQTPAAPAYPGPLATAYKAPPPPGSRPAADAAPVEEEKKE